MHWNHLTLLGIFIYLPTLYSQNYRLPEIAIPSKYVVDLVISDGVFNGSDTTFQGEVNIMFTVAQTTDQIKLHHRVIIDEMRLSSGFTELPISNKSYNSTTEILTVTSTSLYTATNYILYFKYHANFEPNAMKGFYISNYLDENNNKAYLVTTQFQATHARHGFPCFDEPQYKATFYISLTYPTGLNALANTPLETQVSTAGSTKTQFRETAKMSTYLIAFIISNFTCSEGDSIEAGVPHQICSRREEAAHREYAVEIGPPLMRTLESITGIRFGSKMPKVDEVAIPDFSAGAMENWGLVTYRETGLLWSKEDSANSYKKSIALVIAHEFTHSWFGNLVTCKWWDYTFLNEGFARYFQYFAAVATKQFASWELDKDFVVEQVHTAFLVDSSLGAQALTSPSASPSEVSGKFSQISYNKGAAVLRMIETALLGPPNFVYGIRDYLADHQLNATVPEDLWKSLSAHIPTQALPDGLTLSAVLDNWINLSGHPTVTVTKNGNDVVLTQKRFLLKGVETEEREYYIPISYTLSNDTTKFSNTTVKVWLEPGKNLKLSGVLDGNDWIILNNRQSGFYHVNYDGTLWTSINAALHSNHLNIDVLNRAQIISDAYNFARSGANNGSVDFSYADVMNILTYLEYETDYYPWYAAIIGNNYLLGKIGYDTEEGKQFINWMLKLMKKVYSTVPFDILDDDDQVYTMKQTLILARACKYGETNCVKKSIELFANFKNGQKVPKNLRRIVYCNALRYSENPETDFNFLWQKYTETKLMTEILTIFSGLGCVQNEKLLKLFLKQSINTTSGIRLQDFSSVWSYVYTSSKIGATSAMKFISENYDDLVKYYGNVEPLISSVASYFYSDDQLETLNVITNKKEISESDKTAAKNAIKTAEENIMWANKQKKIIKTFIEDETSHAIIFSRPSLLVLIFLLLQVWLIP